MMMTIRNFNSIKVRLKQIFVQRELASSRFQFHKGTIKTSLSEQKQRALQAFQFHKGTIKTWIYEYTKNNTTTISIP